MKLITTIFLLCFLLQGQVFSQDKRDYIWFSASQTDTLPGIETNLFDFNNPSQIVEPGESILRYDRNNALICDREGKLLFYSNGCAVADRMHRIMPNGDSINAGIFFDTSWLGNCDFGFPGRQDIIALPDPADSLGYFLVTKLPEYTLEGEVKQRTVQYSYIDLSQNDGYGDVTIKNKIIHDSVNYSVSCLNAMEHINKTDYWILQPAEDSKVYTFFMDSSGISLKYIQEVSPEVDFLNAVGKGKLDQLDAFMASQINLCVNDSQNKVPKGTAVAKVKSFFEGKKITKFKMMHKGKSSDKSSSYRVARVTTNDGKTYRLFAYAESGGGESKIVEVRINVM